jgi:nitroreductase
MDFLDLVKKRRSVRSYLDKPVSDELLEKVLEAGRLAPSACNNQPWVAIVIKDDASRGKLENVYKREWFLRAPVIIAVCCDRSLSWKSADGRDSCAIDAAIALDHMTLAATELELGTCWVGAFNAAEARKVLCFRKISIQSLFPRWAIPALKRPCRKTVSDWTTSCSANVTATGDFDLRKSYFLTSFAVS